MSRAIRIVMAVAAVLLATAAAAVAATVVGTAGPDTLTGTPGADALYGGAGDDRLDGLAGIDDLDGGPGADDLHGGAGQDAVSYGGRAEAVTVTLDDKPDDGAAGERDDVHRDIEDIYGGDGDDTLTGSSGANTIDGGPANDTIVGGKGTDGLYGGPGDDAIDSKDGTVDTVDCGPGSDIVDADRADNVKNCEHRGSGRAQPSAKTTGAITNLWTAGATTTVTVLVVHDLDPSTANVDLRCHGGGCPFGSRRFPTSGAGAQLTPAFKGAKLKPGATVVITLTSPGTLGKYVKFSVRDHKIPAYKAACVAPGATAPIKCP
jgi:hypothetical protein